MKDLERNEWTHQAYRSGPHKMQCLTNSERSNEAIIVHQSGRVLVRLAYWRAGVLHEHFLEIPDSEAVAK